jgi:hypothetical protein
MFENQCAQFVGCLYGSALNRGPDPFYANGNLAGSAWMADGSVYQTEQAASILPLCRPLCLSEQQGLEKQLNHLGLAAHARQVAALRKRPRKVDQIKSFEFAFT